MARTKVPNTSIDSSLLFDGGTNTCVTSNNENTKLSVGTLSIWFKPTRTNSSYRVLAAKNNAFGIFLKADVLITYDWGGTTDRTTGITPAIGKWNLATMTFQSGVTNGTKIYLNDTLVLTTTITVSNQNTALAFGNTGGQCLNGHLTSAKLWDKVLDATEVTQLYATGSVATTNLIGDWPLSGGTSTTAVDIKNSNNATISGAVWSRDTPLKTRKPVYGNLVYNGNFELYPPFTAATTTNSRWVDGTSGGSTTNDTFGWYIGIGGTSSAQFDTTTKHSGSASWKLSTLATGSYIESRSTDSGYNDSLTYSMRIKPYTSYTCTYYMKTNVTSGDATNGAYLAVLLSGADRVTASSQLGTAVKTTTDWTKYTITFTTTAHYYAHIEPRIYGHQGTATLIMDAWFDDITLVETTTPPRVITKDFAIALKNNATTDNLPIGSAALATAMNSAYTCSIWFKRARLGVVDGMFRDFSGDKFWFNFQSDGRLRVYHSDLTPASVTATNVPPSDMKWHHHVATYDGSTVKLYTDGIQVGSTSVTGTLALSSDMRVPDAANGALGSFDEIRIWNRALSASEVLSLYTGVVNRSGLVREYLMDTNTSTTAYDTSTSAVNATITGATGTSDTPTKLRSIVNSNLVNNGSFELAPATNVAMTGNNWIDGTAAGSSTNVYRWRKYSNDVAETCQFYTDSTAHPHAMKLTNAGGADKHVWVGTDQGTAVNSPTAVTLFENAPRIQPSTSYTLSVDLKLSMTPASGQINVLFRTYSLNGTLNVNTTVTLTGITTEWKTFTLTRVTGAADAYAYIVLKNGAIGVTAVAGDLMVDNVTLTPTTPEARSTA